MPNSEKNPDSSERRLDADGVRRFLENTPVFFVGSNTDSTVLVAVKPSLQKESAMLSWWDTVKERTKIMQSVQSLSDKQMVWQDTDGVVYYFVPLNLQLYRSTVLPKMNRARDYATEEEMFQSFFNSTKFE